jgi:hypothetical protein
MSYIVLTAVLFAFVAIMHGWRIYKDWEVRIGPPLCINDRFMDRTCRRCPTGGLGLLAIKVSGGYHMVKKRKA